MRWPWEKQPDPNDESWQAELQRDYKVACDENQRLRAENKYLRRFAPIPIETTGELGDADHPAKWELPPEVVFREALIEDAVRDRVRAENANIIDELRTRLRNLERFERLASDFVALYRAADQVNEPRPRRR